MAKNGEKIAGKFLVVNCLSFSFGGGKEWNFFFLNIFFCIFFSF